MNEPLLQVENLSTRFRSREGEFRAVDGISFTLQRGETLGVVGESGCGKSVTSLSIMRLVPEPPGKISAERLRFLDHDLLAKNNREMAALRGRDLSMIFQEPMTSLNPAYTIGEQIVEAIRLHQPASLADARKHTLAMLKQVGIPSPEQRIDAYPHQLSGGMRQRVMIAMALVCKPQLLIADEPTTALDVTIQAQILDLLRQLREQTGTAIILITHDLGVIAELAQRVIVMYAGKIVEQASTEALFRDPQHPYTLGLLSAVPKLDDDDDDDASRPLATIEGTVPNPYQQPAGCKFHPRCPFAIDRCREAEPALRPLAAGHLVACWRAPLEADYSL